MSFCWTFCFPFKFCCQKSRDDLSTLKLWSALVCVWVLFEKIGHCCKQAIPKACLSLPETLLVFLPPNASGIYPPFPPQIAKMESWWKKMVWVGKCVLNICCWHLFEIMIDNEMGEIICLRIQTPQRKALPCPGMEPRTVLQCCPDTL